jgi:hypothetical protein
MDSGTSARGAVLCPVDNVETGLRCGRCDTPICPRCMVMSPVGARCKTCAPMRRAPMYEVRASHLVRAGGAALVGGIAMGLIWGFIGAAFSFGFFLIFLGAGLGYAFTRMMEFATRGKRGPLIIGFAIAGIAIAWGMQFLFVPAPIARMQIVAAGIAAYMAYMNLR